jgi:hypothetical protein
MTNFEKLCSELNSLGFLQRYLINLFDDLKSDERNLTDMLVECEYDKSSQILGSSFFWGKTTEGFEFWNEINEKLNNLKSKVMAKVAVIIKHPYRQDDYRVDIFELPEEMSYADLKEYVERKMLGPFEVVSITDRIDFDRKINN